LRVRRLRETARQIAGAMNSALNVEHGIVVTIENQMFLEWSLDGETPEVMQYWI